MSVAAKAANAPQPPAGTTKLVEAHVPRIPVEKLADQLGRWAFSYRLKRARVSEHASHQAVSAKVLARLASKASHDGTPSDYHLKVIEDDRVDAIAFPGGGILVHSGLIRFAQGNEEWLAVAIAHEMAHVTRGHFAARLAQQAAVLQRVTDYMATHPRWMDEGFDAELTVEVLGVFAVSEASAVSNGISFRPEQELEADREGLRTMETSGYDPATALRFWEAEAEHPGSRSLSWTHPTDEARMRALREDLVAMGVMPAATMHGRSATEVAPDAQN
jgi:predicted Zn-dependent protease